MKIFDIYLAVSTLCATLQVLLTIRCIKYITKIDEDKELKSIVIKHLLKDSIQMILKCCIPVYHIIIFIGLSVMILFDSVEKNLSSMGFLTYDNKLVKINNRKEK